MTFLLGLRKGVGFILIFFIPFAVCLPTDSLDPLQQLAQARTWLSRGRFEKARAAVLEVISRENRLGRAYELLGIIQDAQKQYDEAGRAYLKAIELIPADASPHVNLAVNRLRRGQSERAIEEF